MDGIIAVAFLIGSLTDMTRNHCGEGGCLARSSVIPTFWAQAGQLIFDGDGIGPEIAIGRDIGFAYGPYRPAYALSVGIDGETWFGIGARWTHDLGRDTFIEASLFPGLYLDGQGPDLGSPVQFRAALGVGHVLANGLSVTLSFDHRSNADLSRINPGLETFSIRFALPLD